MGMEVTGRVHAIFDAKQVSERFTKQDFVLELIDNPKYPQVVQFQITGDRISQLYGVQVGDQVRVEFNLRGREWRSPQGETKYFNTLDVWKVEPKSARGAGGGNGGGSGGRQRQNERFSAPPGGGDNPDDDIPFASCELAHEPSPIAKVIR